MRVSSNFEDIIYVLDNGTNLMGELKSADKEVVDFLKSECNNLLANTALEETIACALPLNSDNERIHFVIHVIQQIVEI